jgi:hypothetical protein
MSAVMQCGAVHMYRCFGGTYCPHLQDGVECTSERLILSTKLHGVTPHTFTIIVLKTDYKEASTQLLSE